MNLLSELFSDDIMILSLNRKYLLIVIVIVILTILLLIIKVDCYYHSSFNIVDEKTVLLAEREAINKIKNSKEIILDGIKCDYSIKDITSLNDNYLIDVSLKTPIKNISNGTYEIYLGKERLFDYIIRIIRK